MEYLRRALRLYPEEVSKTLQFAFLSFLWSFAASGSVTFFDGLFLEVVGANWLPRAYGFVSLSLMVVSLLLFKGLQKVSLAHLSLAVQSAVGGTFLLGFGLITLASSQTFFWLFGLKVFATVSYAALSITYWSFIDQYYDLQDAKRIYTLVMAALFLGAIASGTYISELSATLGIHGMLFSFIGAIAAAAWLTHRINQRERPVHDELEELPGARSYALSSWVAQITGSAFALFLIANNILAQLLWNVSEFNYLSSFSATFALQPTYELTAFLGKIKAWISTGNVVFMLFFYSRLIHRIGLNRAVIIPYLLFAALYVVWISSPSFAIAIAGIIAVEGALFTIEDNNFNLLLGIIPAKVKRSLRVFIEAFVEPLGILIAAGLLTFESKAIFIGLVIAFLSVAVAWGLHNSYTWAILDNLRSKSLGLTRKASEILRSISKRERRALLGQASRGELPPLFGLQACLACGSLEAARGLLSHFPKYSEADQSSLLELLLSLDLTEKQPLLAALCKLAKEHTHPQLQILLALGDRLKESDALILIERPDPRLQAAGIIALDKACGSRALDEAYTLRSMAAFALQRLLSSSDPHAVSMGLLAQGYMKHQDDLDLLIPYLKESAPAVQLAAAQSIHRLIDPANIKTTKLLIEALSTAQTQEVRLELILAIQKALESKLALPFARVAMRLSPLEKRAAISALSSGSVSIDTLLELTANTNLDHRARLLCGKALAKLGVKQLRRNLRGIIIPEIKRAQAYFWHAHQIKQTDDHDLRLVAECMEGSFHHLIDFVIGLLAASGSIEESELITHSLRSHNEKTHSHGVETVEKTCDKKIFRLLEPLIDDRPNPDKVRRLPSLAHEGVEAILQRLESSSLPVDRLISWHTRAKLKIGDWRALTGAMRKTDDPLFNHFISELLQEDAKK